MARKNRIQNRNEQITDVQSIQEVLLQEENSFNEVDEFSPSLRWHLIALASIGTILLLLYWMYFTLYAS
ncbi:MAG: hypothetical protein CVV64_06790 [Candidatus Wallbacteria bacterium HGW-Wallbacteria-1]|jgi:hypothetical protein|uniref:Uncharacterized protein n=1 Tax=Candidatus Wallbacteria bacterium HGW-Wallbacteria-1 TaxID=2013854 RepID=A0A2N1PT04_9BACT|nr:MAG: hypothetical protein CVV64_06790 [Candidatus Wallbacteria bacterium HGW-Wallbacteria-1]